MVAVMSASSAGLYSLLAASGLQNLMVGLYVSLGTVLVFLFGILYVISISTLPETSKNCCRCPCRPMRSSAPSWR
jgi:hypothetical protein